MKRYTIFMDWIDNIVEMTTVLKFRFSAIPIKILTSLFENGDNLILKFMCKGK